MLQDSRVAAMIPTNDLPRAREFYEGKLGLIPETENAGGVLYMCAAGTGFSVFVSSGKSSGTHTQLGFEVEDANAEASALASKGITPEPVEIPGAEVENGVSQMPNGRGFWIKDPDDNLIGIFQRAEVPAAAGS
jgi:catechol 2,3-dioxygenase-like lactoylglutathione lyase family enzyme